MRLREAAMDFLAYFLWVFQNLCDSLLSDTISHAEMFTFPWWTKKAVCILAFFLGSPEASFLADPLVVGCEWEMAERGEIASALPTTMCCTQCLCNWGRQRGMLASAGMGGERDFSATESEVLVTSVRTKKNLSEYQGARSWFLDWSESTSSLPRCM